MAGALTISTLNNDTGVLATQNGMTGIAKAWLNYNGVTQTINGSFNISSVTRNGTGDYTINFTTVMPNANYAAVALTTTITSLTATSVCEIYNTGTPSITASNVRITTSFVNTGNNRAPDDKPVLCVAILGA